MPLAFSEVRNDHWRTAVQGRFDLGYYMDWRHSSPITVLEQITYLMFMKLLDDNQLNSNVDGSPEENLSSVKRAVDAFVGDAEQFDDLTMMCLEYKGT